MAFRCEIPVRFADCDAAWIVYHPRIPHFCHVAMETMFARHVGVPYARALREEDVGYPTVRLEAEYSAADPDGRDAPGGRLRRAPGEPERGPPLRGAPRRRRRARLRRARAAGRDEPGPLGEPRHAPHHRQGFAALLEREDPGPRTARAPDRSGTAPRREGFLRRGAHGGVGVVFLELSEHPRHPRGGPPDRPQGAHGRRAHARLGVAEGGEQLVHRALRRRADRADRLGGALAKRRVVGAKRREERRQRRGRTRSEPREAPRGPRAARRDRRPRGGPRATSTTSPAPGADARSDRPRAVTTATRTAASVLASAESSARQHVLGIRPRCETTLGGPRPDRAVRVEEGATAGAAAGPSGGRRRRGGRARRAPPRAHARCSCRRAPRRADRPRRRAPRDATGPRDRARLDLGVHARDLPDRGRGGEADAPVVRREESRGRGDHRAPHAVALHLRERRTASRATRGSSLSSAASVAPRRRRRRAGRGSACAPPSPERRVRRERSLEVENGRRARRTNRRQLHADVRLLVGHRVEEAASEFVAGRAAHGRATPPRRRARSIRRPS